MITLLFLFTYLHKRRAEYVLNIVLVNFDIHKPASSLLLHTHTCTLNTEMLPFEDEDKKKSGNFFLTFYPLFLCMVFY